MSFVKPTLYNIVKKQYVYKLSAYAGSFSTLVFIQILALVFSFSGSEMMGSGNMFINVNIYYYSANLMIIFTIIWGIITSYTITTKPYANPDFLFVTNRFASNLSNVFFLVTASIVGGVTAMLSGFLLKVIIFLTKGTDNLLIQPSTHTTLTEFAMGVFATILYVLLASSVGYFAGMLKEISKLLFMLIVTTLIGGLLIGLNIGGGIAILFQSLFMESSFPLFVTKMIIVIITIFIATFLLTNKMEVKS